MNVFLDMLSHNRNIFMLLLLILLFLLFTLIVPHFFSIYNIFNMTQYGVEIGLLAFAEVFVIISGGGGIDLSVGSLLSLSAMIIGVLVGRYNFNIWIAVIIGIGAAGLGGVFNGFMVSFAKIPPLLATLASMYIFDSFALLVSVEPQFGNPMPISKFPDSYFFIGQSTILGIPFQVLFIFLPIFFILNYYLKHTIYGRFLYAVGINDKAAYFSNVPVKKVRFFVYVIGGLLVGIAAVIMTSRIASARPDLGVGYNLQAITIAVLGGINIFGGEGDLLGVLISIGIIVVLYNGLQLAGVNAIWQMGTLGLVLVGSTIVNYILSKRSLSNISSNTSEEI
ncbi:MAG TPA: ABC transporter permease [Candidatus Atribacteria bacterium]|nr:ABC transporter permease [Candidatus Atribacteria bacterium]